MKPNFLNIVNKGLKMKMIVMLVFFLSCNETYLSGMGQDYRSTKGLIPKELQGEDQNKNHIRDDVEKWVEENIKEKNLKKGYLQKAKYTFESYDYLDDKEKSNYYEDKIQRSGTCINLINRKIDYEIRMAGLESDFIAEKYKEKTRQKIKIVEANKDFTEDEKKEEITKIRDRLKSDLAPVREKHDPARVLMRKQEVFRSNQHGRFNGVLLNTKARDRAAVIRSNHGAGSMFILANSMRTACDFKYEE